MTKKNFWVSIFILLFSTTTFSQSKQQKAVAAAVQQLRTAMIDADKNALEKIVDDDLSYGHSSGVIENKTEFVEKLVSGRSDFVTMELTNQTILVEDKTAIVRHELQGDINDNNKPGKVHLLVMLVFVKDDGKWKLLGRQAVKKV